MLCHKPRVIGHDLLISTSLFRRKEEATYQWQESSIARCVVHSICTHRPEAALREQGPASKTPLGPAIRMTGLAQEVSPIFRRLGSYQPIRQQGSEGVVEAMAPVTCSPRGPLYHPWPVHHQERKREREDAF